MKKEKNTKNVDRNDLEIILNREYEYVKYIITNLGYVVVIW